MKILNKVEIVRHDRFAGIHSYSFDDDQPQNSLKIRLCVRSGQMDIDAEDLAVLSRAIELFKVAEKM